MFCLPKTAWPSDFKAIKEGVKEKGGDNVLMKAFDSLSDDEIKGLVAYVRAFKK